MLFLGLGGSGVFMEIELFYTYLVDLWYKIVLVSAYTYPYQPQLDQAPELCTWWIIIIALLNQTPNLTQIVSPVATVM